ncbi:MAG: TetR/AcrR family transcriptional regulator [Solobacterium sp.]|jgi:AcrR family transcriptional regulator|nr:TetR/AcrR family transcriptional regulator [Solobacterium sp.]
MYAIKMGGMKEDNETRKKIRDNALRLFQENGYDAVTINAICKASGISKNTFYYYYTEKKDLLFSIIHPSEESRVNIMYALAGISSPYDKLKAACRQFLEYLLYLGPSVVRKMLELHLASAMVMQGDHHPTEFGKLLLTLFQQAQQNGEIRKDVPAEELMRGAWFLIAGVVQTWAVNEGKMDLEETYLHQFEILLKPQE